MKIRLTWLVVLAAAGIGASTAWAAKKAIVMSTPEELKWIDVPDAGGAQVANITGDVFKGAYTALAKIPAGQVHPLHTHTSATTAVVVSGTFIVTPEGGVEKRLGPGSTFTIPGGVKHASSCAPGVPCLLYQSGPAKFDMKPVPGAAAPAAAAPAPAAPAAAAPAAAAPAAAKPAAAPAPAGAMKPAAAPAPAAPAGAKK